MFPKYLEWRYENTAGTQPGSAKGMRNREEEKTAGSHDNLEEQVEKIGTNTSKMLLLTKKQGR